jgi:retron-type reverse transcriptase
MKIQLAHKFQDIVSLDNLLSAWREFLKGKRNKKDVQEFSFHLMDNIISLHRDLVHHTYKHGGYQAFNISDPKPRNIHKASVRDRLLHHAIYRKIYPFFDKTFIADSFSCRIGKGTHSALNKFRSVVFKVTKNNTKTCWILKCDIKKFFASIDHDVLMAILRKYIADDDILWLLEKVIDSFPSNGKRIGLPLGNLTSQLFVNIYMNEFDQFLKHKLKVKYCIRYADDFVIFSENREGLEEQIPVINNFLQKNLKLTLNPQKVFIKTLASGIDFLGWSHFPDHRVLRATTRRRMKEKIRVARQIETFNSYLGLLGHGNTHRLKKEVLGLAGKVIEKS